MTNYQVNYYKEMMIKERLMPIEISGKVVGLITFYIGSLPERYVRDDPWEVLDDEPNTGTVCFVDQCWGNKEFSVNKFSFLVWKTFKNFIKSNFNQVKYIRWNRFKDGKNYIFIRSI